MARVEEEGKGQVFVEEVKKNKEASPARLCVCCRSTTEPSYGWLKNFDFSWYVIDHDGDLVKNLPPRFQGLPSSKVPPFGFSCTSIGSRVFLMGGDRRTMKRSSSDGDEEDDKKEEEEEEDDADADADAGDADELKEVEERKVSASVFSFDLKDNDIDNCWKEEKRMLKPRLSPHLFPVNGRIYALGFCDPDAMCGPPHPFAEVYNISSETWTTLPAPPIIIPPSSLTWFINFAFLYKETHIFVCLLTCFLSLDLKTHQWTDVSSSFPSLLEPGYYGDSAEIDDLLFVLYIDKVMVYDLLDKVWFPEPIIGLSVDYMFEGANLVPLGDKTLGLFCNQITRHWRTNPNEYNAYCVKFKVRPFTSPTGQKSVQSFNVSKTPTLTLAGLPYLCFPIIEKEVTA